MKEPEMQKTIDQNGTAVCVGTKVRVLGISSTVLASLNQSEAQRVRSMLGEVFEVYEVDEYGGAWVEKWWETGAGKKVSHSLALAPAEMAVVA